MSWEVWTMKSKMSFFDATLLKKNISRFAPAWGLLTLVLFLSMPLPLMQRLGHVELAMRGANARDLLEAMADMGIIYSFGAAAIFAALVFKYLHKTQSAYMMHAFPMTRSCHFVTNAVSGLLFWVVPALFITLINLTVLAAFGVTSCTGLAWAAFGKWLLAFLCFYGIAVFTMHISGRTVIAILSYCALNFIFLLIPLLVLLLVDFYFVGFDYSVPETILRLCPIVTMLRDGSGEPTVAMLISYAVLGLVLLVLAWVHYRFRQVERAGDPMVFQWARIAFRVVFTLCCALGFGWILAAFFGLLDAGRNGVFLPYALIGCFLGWFSSSMMLERTVKVFRNKKVWLGFAVFAAVLALAVLGLKYDLLGLQRRVPETAQVESVEIWTAGNYDSPNTDCISLTEAEQIDVVRAFHQKALEDPNNQSGARRSVFDGGYYDSLHVCYHLSGGGTLQRVYRVPEREYKALAQLYADPEIAAAWYEKALPEKFSRVTLDGMEEYEVDQYGNETYGTRERACKDPAALREAVLADAGAGRLPVVNFLTRNVILQTEGSYYQIRNELYLYFDNGVWPDGTKYSYMSIPIASTAVETLALFETQ